jgi:hypothetical protein
MKHQILLLTEDLKKDAFIVLVYRVKTSSLWQIYCPVPFSLIVSFLQNFLDLEI